MFLVVQWSSSNWFATILDKNTLNNNCENDNEEEEEVVEKSVEDVVFFHSKLSCIDFVEYLHKDKHVEDQSVVLGLQSWLFNTINSFIEWSSFLIIRNAKQVLTEEEHYNQEHSLENSLTNNISPHNWSHNKFCSAVRRFLKNIIAGWFSC